MSKGTRKVKGIKAEDRLWIVENILAESAAGEDVLMDILQKRPHTKKEIELAELFTLLYRIIHPGGTCKNPHIEWEKENKQFLITFPAKKKEKKTKNS